MQKYTTKLQKSWLQLVDVTGHKIDVGYCLAAIFLHSYDRMRFSIFRWFVAKLSDGSRSFPCWTKLAIQQATNSQFRIILIKSDINQISIHS